MDELDKLYSPSYWSKRYSSPDDVITHHLKFIEASQRVSAEIPSRVNIPYGPSERQKFDIIGTDLDEDAPVLIFIHGGYWQEKDIDRKSYHFIARNLHENGIKTIFVGYDLCPHVPLPQILHQVKAAARECLEYAKQSKGVFFMGHSAGAHLAASLLAEPLAGVRGAILISGVFDLSPLRKTLINEPLKLDEKVAAEMSPLKWNLEGGGDCELSLIVGAEESPEFIKQSKEFHEKLKESGFRSCFKVVDDVDHYDIIELLADVNYELTKHIVDVVNKH